MFAIEVHERVEREAVEIDGESNEEMYIERESERGWFNATPPPNN